MKDESISLKYFTTDDRYYVRGTKYEKELIIKDQSYTEFQHGVCHKMKEIFPNRIENKAEGLVRATRFMKFIMDFADENKAQSNEIMVITHNKFIGTIRKLKIIKINEKMAHDAINAKPIIVNIWRE